MGSKPKACLSSGVMTCSAGAALVVCTTAGWLCHVNCIIATTGDLNVFAYDNAVTASGTILYRRKLDSSTIMGTGGSRIDVFPIPISFGNGLVLTCTGTAPDGAIAGYATRSL